MCLSPTAQSLWWGELLSHAARGAPDTQRALHPAQHPKLSRAPQNPHFSKFSGLLLGLRLTNPSYCCREAGESPSGQGSPVAQRTPWSPQGSPT